MTLCALNEGLNWLSMTLEGVLRQGRLYMYMDGALHTDFTKSETSGGIKTIISPFVYL